MALNSIFMVGHFRPGDLGRSFQQAFEAIGVHTHVEDTRDSHGMGWVVRNRIPHRLTIRSGLIRRHSVLEFNRLLEDTVLRSGAQVLMIVTLEFLLSDMLHNLRNRGVRVVIYHPDNPFPPHMMNRPETLPAARESDLYLHYSDLVVQKLKGAGIPNPVFLPFAWDSEAFPYQNDQPQGTWPGALFIGTWDRYRERFLEKLARYVPLRIYGNYWGTRTMPFSRVRRCWQGRSLHLVDAARAIRESAVCLNVLRPQHIIDGVPDGLLMRHFEVPGAGGFLLSTRGGGATTLFPEGDSGEYFSGVEECAEKIDKYVTNSEARRDFAERAHSLIAAHHQYRDRALQIIRLLDDLPARA